MQGGHGICYTDSIPAPTIVLILEPRPLAYQKQTVAHMRGCIPGKDFPAVQGKSCTMTARKTVRPGRANENHIRGETSEIRLAENSAGVGLSKHEMDQAM